MINHEFYNAFIKVLIREFNTIGVNCSVYDAVLLTVPESQFRWRDRYNDPVVHFLNNARNQIETVSNNSGDIFSVVIRYADRLVKRCQKSIESVYTYRDFEYTRMMFEHIIGCTSTNDENAKIIYDKVRMFLNELILCDNMRDFCSRTGLSRFMNRTQPADEIAHDEFGIKYDNIFICLNKLICAVIIKSDDDTIDDFQINSSMESMNAETFYHYIEITQEICHEKGDYNRKIGLYSQLYSFIIRGNQNQEVDKEIINYISDDCYYNLFKFTNDRENQDKYIFKYINDNHDDRIMKLYRLFDRNVSYSLYRDYRTIDNNDGKGLMRYSMTDRKIVLDYLVDGTEVVFKRSTIDNGNMDFVLRLANESDFENIHKINNPSEPYRRAIYVKSDDNEIEKAIKQNEAYVIEEVLNGNRTLACVAIILNSDNDHSDFNTEELCGRYAKSFMNTYGHRPKYLDFDSVITNNGSAGLGTKSYRGLGFQRLMLVLTEELAVIDNCDYVSATVSTLNNPSKRNFTLNGYEIANSDKYPFKGKGGTEYWDYLSKPGNEEKKRTYLLRAEKEYADNFEVMKDQKIDIDSYKHDKDVPRDFLVLPLKEKLIKHKS